MVCVWGINSDCGNVGSVSGNPNVIDCVCDRVLLPSLWVVSSWDGVCEKSKNWLEVGANVVTELD